MAGLESGALVPDPRAPLPRWAHRSLAEAFDACAERAPDALAVADASVQWSYGELRARSNQLARALLARNVGPGHVVAIHAERNARVVWAILAVLKTGAAFAILDARYPDGRLLAQLAIIKPSALLQTGDHALPPALAASDALPEHRLDLAGQAFDWQSLPTSSPDVVLGAELPAYVTFTSGTTGGPRAIAGAHGPLAHFVDWQAATFELGPEDRFSAMSGVGHDPFLRDVFTPLAIGASVHLPPEQLRGEPDLLAGWLLEQRISVVHLTPSAGEVLALARAGVSLPSLRWLFFGGETLRGDLVTRLRRIAPTSGFVNFYGTTETPQAMSYFVVGDPVTGVVPVGHGIRGVQLLVLDAKDELTAIGQEGEICVRTQHLAIGYVDGVAGGFGASPFTRDPEDRVYRTGDRGRYLDDGSVMHRGRNDDQVKVRGHRVELLEIESAIRAYPGVQQAAVVLREGADAVAAYFVGDVDASQMMAALRERLPDYMVPAMLVRLVALPLTPNGKVDRRALPTAPVHEGAPLAPAAEAAPANEIEETITAIWKDILDAEVVERHDNFFDLGGHSLNATQVAARLRDAFSIELAVRTIFEAPTVAELSERIIDLVLQAAPADELARAMDHLDEPLSTRARGDGV